jgi:DNA-binding transcriptional ArsR family regulator
MSAAGPDLASAPAGGQDLPAAAGLDRLLHEPARLVIATLLYAVESADFLFLLRESGLSKGNLSSHLARLEAAGYVVIEKTFRGKIPLTVCRLTAGGRDALRRYREHLKRVVDTLPE